MSDPYRTNAIRPRAALLRRLPPDVVAVLLRASLFARRVSVRHDNPPKWADEARELANELDAVFSLEEPAPVSGR